MTDDEARAAQIAWLRDELSTAIAERKRLGEELMHLAAHIHDIRAAFGNPFYYSHPQEPEEGIANYTANSSHKIGMSTLLAFMRVERHVVRLNAQLRALEE